MESNGNGLEIKRYGTERNETLRPGQERFMHLEVQTRV